MKGYLFDTNALLWAALDSPRFDRRNLDKVAGQDRYISQVCAIEIAIKFSVGRFDLPPPFQSNFQTAFSTMCERLSADLLGIEMADVERLSRLPLLHRDPFDRLIIAQALSRGLTVVTGDRAFAAYAGLDVLEI